MEQLGDADTLEAQSRAILLENDIQDKEFSNEVKCQSNGRQLKVFVLLSR